MSRDSKKEAILLISNNYIPSFGGIENSFRSIAEEMTDQGKLVVIVCSDKASGQKDLPEYEVRDEAIVYRYSSSFILGRFTSCLFLLKKINKKYNLSLTLSRNNMTTIACKLAGLPNIKYLAPGVHKYQNKQSSRFSLKMFISYYFNLLYEYINLKSLDTVYVFSEEMSRQVKSVNNNLRIRKVFPGVDRGRFTNQSVTQREKNKAKFGVGSNTKTILFLGRIDIVKRPYDPIDVLSFLSEDFLLMYVGNGPLLEEVKRYAHAVGVSERVMFFGATTEPENFFKASDYFLMTSDYEPFGQTILEALSVGVPIVGYKRGNGINTATEEIFFRLNLEDHANMLTPFSEGPQGIARTIKDSEPMDFKLEKAVSWNNLIRTLMSE